RDAKAEPVGSANPRRAVAAARLGEAVQEEPHGVEPAARTSPRTSCGFVLLELAIAALLITLGAIWMASRMSSEVQDAGARATASYLLNVRGAVHELLVHYFDVLAGYETGDPSVPGFLQQSLPLDISI